MAEHIPVTHVQEIRLCGAGYRTRVSGCPHSLTGGFLHRNNGRHI